MTTSPRVNFVDLVAGQSIPETTVNEMARRLEQGAGHFIFKDRNLSAAPGSPADGDCYLVSGTPGGGDAWVGHGDDIAFYMNTAWEFIEVIEGFTAWVNDENAFIGATSPTAWSVISAAGNPTESILIACSDEATAITAGTAKVTFRMPYAFTLSAVRASVNTAPTGSTIIIDINEGGTTILSTKLSIDTTEKTSTTASSAAVISDTALADDAEITIDFDQVGSTVAGKGVKVALIGVRP